MVLKIVGIAVGVLLVVISIFWDVVDAVDRNGPFYE